MAQPNTNPTPKQRFQSSKAFVEQHRELMQSDILQRGLDYALLEYQRFINEHTNDQFAGAGHLKMAGAVGFIATLKNLGETAEMPLRIVDRDNLKPV